MSVHDQVEGGGAEAGGHGDKELAPDSPALHTGGVFIENSTSGDPVKCRVVGGDKNVKVDPGVDENESLVKIFPEFAHGLETIGSVRNRVDNDDPMLEYFGSNGKLKSATPVREAARVT